MLSMKKLALLMMVFICTSAYSAKWYKSGGDWIFSSLPEFHEIIKMCKQKYPEPKSSDFYEKVPCGPGHPAWVESAKACFSDGSESYGEEGDAARAAYKKAKKEASDNYQACRRDEMDKLYNQHPHPEGLTTYGHKIYEGMEDQRMPLLKDPSQQSCSGPFGGIAVPEHCKNKGSGSTVQFSSSAAGVIADKISNTVPVPSSSASNSSDCLTFGGGGCAQETEEDSQTEQQGKEKTESKDKTAQKEKTESKDKTAQKEKSGKLDCLTFGGGSCSDGDEAEKDENNTDREIASSAGGSCTPEKMKEIQEKYRLSAKVLTSALKKRAQKSGCSK